MANEVPARPRSARLRVPSIETIVVEGFKSHRDRAEVRVRPLTVLAGQNSAGKSSLIQPLLIAKQTLEVPWDPGALALEGPCFHGATAAGLLWRGSRRSDHARQWTFGVSTGDRVVSATYTKGPRGGFSIASTTLEVAGQTYRITDGPAPPEVSRAVLGAARRNVSEDGLAALADHLQFEQGRVAHTLTLGRAPFSPISPNAMLEAIIHLPGLRGNPERAYQVTRTGGNFPGPFSPYAASVLLTMQDEHPDQAQGVSDDLRALGVTWKAAAQRVRHSDSHVEVRVGRLPQALAGGAKDLVNIADVGFGASQVLPVVVALRVARPGQLVHIEQPELHLHPNAQVAMAGLLVQAARRQVKVVAETHSSVLVKAIQLAVARGELPPADVALHWLSRDADGASKVHPGNLEHDGAYGDWPIDFADVEMDVEARFIDASLSAQAER
ncbi:MAG TPA: AAA family ATPase [Myxococcota bacterium]|nr:AAA family ATPase [Myxococcota bacterium]